jgi:hypothetical protein
MSRWQPIETAPKDGSRFLLYDGFIMAVAKWSGRDWVMAWNNDSLTEDNHTPSHWMPLPSEPEED